MTAEEYLMNNLFDTDFHSLEGALVEFARIKCEEVLRIFTDKDGDSYYVEEYKVLTDSELDKIFT